MEGCAKLKYLRTVKQRNTLMKATKVKQKKFNARRKYLMRMLEARGNSNHQAVVERADNGSKVIVFRSELDYLSHCIMEYPNIETGGQLFGYWTSAGEPIVMYAIGPGPRANHQSTFFNQDVDYLVRVGKLLKERYGLHHIGEWHSHHQLGLARPSGHDAHTMNSTIHEKGLGRFLLCIGNIRAGRASIGAFLCDGNSCCQMNWTTIEPESPIRSIVDGALSDILVHPRGNAQAREMSERIETRPAYAPGYWLSESGAGTVLNNIITYLKGRNRGADVKPQLNGRGEVQVRLEYGCRIENILFPNGFPDRAPLMMRYRNGILEDASSAAGWTYFEGDILHSFIAFYENN